MAEEKPKREFESVWNYPRPPRLEKFPFRLTVEFNGKMIADTKNAYRIVKKCFVWNSNSYSITDDIKIFGGIKKYIRLEYLKKQDRQTFCEWKGVAGYYDVLVDDKKAHSAAWFYSEPTTQFQPIKDYVSFYASKMDKCTVDDEVVKPQQSDFYGGWIDSYVTGGEKGMKGPKGTEFW